MSKNYNYFVVMVCALLISCEKCDTYFKNNNLPSTFIKLNCKLNYHDIEAIDNSLEVQVLYKDKEMEKAYSDSILVYAVNGNKDTLTLKRKSKLNFLFEANKNIQLEKLDLKLYFYSKGLSLKNDTVLNFVNMKRAEECYRSTAFH